MPEDEAHSPTDEDEDDSLTNGSDASSEAPVELLVTGRVKRAGAGNRIQTLIAQEEDEDELAEYIKNNAEEVDSEEDVDFIGDDDEAASDAQLDSSSEDEEQGADKANDDLEGEKQLRKQERVEKQKKRKLQPGFKVSTTASKKAKFDLASDASATLPKTPAPKTKKKSERVSWIPTADGGAVRSSSRKQTVKNKETIHLRMAEKEKQRIKQMKHMEEAEKKRQAARAPPMTQAERIAEAARVERKNAKSLNRWEESERQRAEAQKAKLQALHSRQLSGPVITWWSGLARWVDNKLSQIGIREIEAAEKANNLSKLDDTDANAILLTKTVIPSPTHREVTLNGTSARNSQTERIYNPAEPAPPQDTDQPAQIGFEPTPGLGLLDGIQYYASLPSQTKENIAMDYEQPRSPMDGRLSPENPANRGPDPIEHPAAFVEKSATTLYTEYAPPLTQMLPQEPIIELASRTLVVLRNIDSNAMSLPELQGLVLLKKRNSKVQSRSSEALKVFGSSLLTPSSGPAQEACAITGFPARFRDPKTGLAYADSYAYREIQRLRNGGSRWSNLLGCYVGSATATARGVPERFRR